MTGEARSGYRALERRATAGIVGALVSLAGLAWWSTVDRARGMRGMVAGIGSVGPKMMPLDMSIALFMWMWITMMVAMMFPTIAPIVLLHRMVLKKRGAGPALTVAFVLGYLIAWAVAGLVPLAVLIGLRHVGGDRGWIAPVSGAILVLAGAYQFTSWKETCQRACRSPLTFLATHDFGVGAAGALRAGASHGLYCLGCCWALMTVLLVVGLMNLVWMVALAVIFLAEKHGQRAAAMTKTIGLGISLLGMAITAHPALLTTVAS